MYTLHAWGDIHTFFFWILVWKEVIIHLREIDLLLIQNTRKETNKTNNQLLCIKGYMETFEKNHSPLLEPQPCIILYILGLWYTLFSVLLYHQPQLCVFCFSWFLHDSGSIVYCFSLFLLNWVHYKLNLVLVDPFLYNIWLVLQCLIPEYIVLPSLTFIGICTESSICTDFGGC